MNCRRYVYGIMSDGGREFLHSHLDERDAKGYIKKHRKLFPERYVSYSIYSGDTEILKGL